MEMGELVWLCQRGDAFAKRQIDDLQDPSKSKAERSPWKVDAKGLLRYNNAAYIPPDKALQLEIMRINHDDLQGGHFELNVRKKVFGPNIIGMECYQTSNIMFEHVIYVNM